MEPAAEIAVQAWRFRTLAEHPALLYTDRKDRRERALASRWGPLDALLVASADDTDVLCADAVVKLSSEQSRQALLDFLSVLPGNRRLAIYYAVAPERRAVVSEHYAWAGLLASEPEGIEDYMEELRPFARWDASENAIPYMTRAEREEFEQFNDGLMRRTLGLPDGLNDEQRALADLGEAAAESALAKARGD